MLPRLLSPLGIVAALGLTLYALPAPPPGQTLLALGAPAPTTTPAPAPAPARPKPPTGIDCTTGVSCPLIWSPKK